MKKMPYNHTHRAEVCSSQVTIICFKVTNTNQHKGEREGINGRRKRRQGKKRRKEEDTEEEEKRPGKRTVLKIPKVDFLSSDG